MMAPEMADRIKALRDKRVASQLWQVAREDWERHRLAQSLPGRTGIQTWEETSAANRNEWLAETTVAYEWIVRVVVDRLEGNFFDMLRLHKWPDAHAAGSEENYRRDNEFIDVLIDILRKGGLDDG